ncbi:UDP-N-acetylmuramate dehydrogenase [Desulfovibrio sp. OttesenSCG-928-O18]|nr:UDP-N-acetylmuramate dehydrogenase [Desulfovibrio sp. OttesenSCG-928-O18]
MAATGLSIFEGREAPTMAERTTLRLGGPVLAEVALTGPEAADRLPGIASRLGGRLVSIGAGSNILAGGGPLPLVLVKNAMPPEITVVEENRDTVTLRAASSVKLPVLLGRAASMDLAGLEGLSGIPGSVGGAVAMNAGSFGQSVSDTLTALTLVTARGEIRTVPRENICFAYRHMGLPGLASGAWYMILSADFVLTRSATGVVAAAGKAHMAQKKASQPVGAASAGCVFKNPAPENPAGKLLDEAGFKGKRLGDMAFSTVHANFLVNEGQGSSDQALELMEMAKRAVFERSGIILEPEVKLWL